jgi:hypothetical protein
MMAEKDHEGFFRALAAWPGWQWVWCYTADSPRAAAAGDLAAVAVRQWGVGRVKVFTNLETNTGFAVPKYRQVP